jgi:hypothetical protein
LQIVGFFFMNSTGDAGAMLLESQETILKTSGVP